MKSASEATSTYDLITLVVAIAGFGLALLSLGWQAATFFLTGSRVRAKLLRGALAFGGRVTQQPEKWDRRQLELLAQQGPVEEILAVEVRNVGRLPVNVESVTAYLDNGIGWNEPGGSNAALPHRLEPGSSETWHVRAEALARLMVASDLQRTRVRFVVGLGTGKSAETNRVAVP